MDTYIRHLFTRNNRVQIPVDATASVELVKSLSEDDEILPENSRKILCYMLNRSAVTAGTAVSRRSIINLLFGGRHANAQREVNNYLNDPIEDDEAELRYYRNKENLDYMNHELNGAISVLSRALKANGCYLNIHNRYVDRERVYNIAFCRDSVENCDTKNRQIMSRAGRNNSVLQELAKIL